MKTIRLLLLATLSTFCGFVFSQKLNNRYALDESANIFNFVFVSDGKLRNVIPVKALDNLLSNTPPGKGIAARFAEAEVFNKYELGTCKIKNQTAYCTAHADDSIQITVPKSSVLNCGNPCTVFLEKTSNAESSSSKPFALGNLCKTQPTAES